MSDSSIKLPQAAYRNYPRTTGEQQCVGCGGWIIGGIWRTDFTSPANQYQGPYCGHCASKEQS
ncbi:hypothetical protein KAR91_09265 [Candidatus Pacearchaeota archaeon]|nr:hypothetical protein [Candidatus Pacearchaeota archaeon]